ncbi:hypothetical protein CERZMDRAFT_91603 [Cercospora zeae-maydis SCOH1-5]|uniref:Uncharacterized protein n=1 Tax=Cercospora zeae-maydis SCOH1-5 TaxID=717836 RepID=A0A6A6F3E1_9PEZI|nr:hypothetical protein CERZMDRAFT_91603 [Cercospora zeae-maydis SCOH1-5]
MYPKEARQKATKNENKISHCLHGIDRVNCPVLFQSSCYCRSGGSASQVSSVWLVRRSCSRPIYLVIQRRWPNVPQRSRAKFT